MPYFMNVIVLMNVSFIKKGQTVGRNRIKREEEGSRKKYPGICDSSIHGGGDAT